MERKAPLILLIENDEDDVFFFRRVLAIMYYDCKVHVLSTASEARQYLESTASGGLPDVIVSDFWLSGETILKFVQWLRDHPLLGRIPLVILSGMTDLHGRLAGLMVKNLVQKTANLADLAARLRPLLP